VSNTPPRGPRAHWILVGLLLVALLAELCLHGYATNAGGDGRGRPPPAGGVAAPATVLNGGPVLRLTGNSVQSARLPAKTIALTFDDGPDPRWTPQILGVLDKYHVHATFFEIGSQVNEHPELARAVVAQGSEIGVHTFTHPDLTTAPAWRRRIEVSLGADSIASATGIAPRLMRPPYSSVPDAVRAGDLAAWRGVAGAGYLIVIADLDSVDWKRPGVDAIVREATPSNGAGAIVLLHDGGGNRSETVAALRILIPRLKAAGYRFTTVSEALSLPAPARATTSQRVRGQVMRLLQRIGDGAATAMTVLLAIALALGVLRLPLQAAFAAAHQRRFRTTARRPLRHLGGVSVVVAAYNEAANIAATVTSLVRSDYPSIEVIVVDDGSTDETAAIVRSLRFRNVRVISQENAGKPGALNTGISVARYDILVLVDGDTVFTPRALGRLVQPLSDPEVGAVSGNTKVANRRGLLGRWQHLEYVIGFNLDRRMFDVAGCMPTVPGAIGAFRRPALASVGGVSDQTLAEDTDLTMAIGRAGWRIVYRPDAIAFTEVPSSLRQLWRQRYRWCYGTLQAMWKHRQAVTQRGSAGRLGRRGLTYLLIFQILLPLAAPTVDVFAIYGALFLPWLQVAAVWLGFAALQTLTAYYALHLDSERAGSLWTLPFQQIVYRQLMYLVVVQSTVMALIGGRLHWHRIHRTGVLATATVRQSLPDPRLRRPAPPPRQPPPPRQRPPRRVDSRRR
jgi:cellulose synthase/poly-beta-1,6-N-acetylglucosamine synthase-like glycosyltransferase/peptidoglycan/xylan/chitin deacetylase (PgdA/CDA1 family)